ncbi:hypothetical protein [Tellurirhabdus rosea]|uniref:hypothetical protein n=1 Tax=Tellurirhabdus rosea TaxID=2674997 RepID=UPI00225284D6|nr:hypothetical protein [Tellurirhabdus rosea]
MTTESKYLFDLHTEHTEWINALNLFEDQLQIMTERLAEVSAKNTAPEVKMAVEQFQNRLYIQKNELDYLRHDIKQAENAVVAEVEANPVATDHRKMQDDPQLRDRVNTYKALLKNLRAEFNQFAGENL